METERKRQIPFQEILEVNNTDSSAIKVIHDNGVIIETSESSKFISTPMARLLHKYQEWNYYILLKLEQHFPVPFLLSVPLNILILIPSALELKTIL